MTFSSDEFDVRETYAAQEAALASIWDDPELDVYNDYEAQSSCRTTAGPMKYRVLSTEYDRLRRG